MVIYKKKILFVHVPKTAGQSVTRFFLENLGEKYSLKNKKYGLVFNKLEKLPGPYHYHHCNINEYKSLGLIKNPRHYFKFSIFRNPYTRFVSSFYFNQETHKCQTYKDFIKMYEKTHYSFKEELFRHFIQQTWYVNFKMTNLDKWFLQEDLKPFENFFAKHYTFCIPLKRENVQAVNTQPLDNYSIGFINKYYKQDFDLLGYRYETP